MMPVRFAAAKNEPDFTMKPALLSLGLALLACGTVRSAENPEKVKTEVSKATLFLDGAQATRTVRLTVPAGETTFAFTGLSPYMDAKSLQVTAKGKITILSVETAADQTDSLERSARKQRLKKDEAAAEQQVQRTKAELETVEAEMKLLETNCSASARTVDVPLARVKELTDYYAERLKALKIRQLELKKTLQNQQERYRQIFRQRTEALGRDMKPMNEVRVQVEAAAPCQAEFTLVYYVRNAGWYPCYDIRSAGLSEPVVLSYKARIHQQTCEEWNNTELTLSSSNPTTGTIAPELRTYWLDYGLPAPRYDLHGHDNAVSGTVFAADNGEPLIGATVMVPGTTVATSTDSEGRYSLTLPNGASELRFSYVGMTSVTHPVRGETLDIAMKPTVQALNETVVTAYGTNKLSKTTGRAGSKEIVETVIDYTDFDEEASEPRAVERTRTRMGYEFRLRRPCTVPSGGKPATVEIGRYELPAAYVYRSTPKIDKDAFLTAEATGWAECNLLEGEANVYFEETFVGKSILSPDRTGDTLRFSMGRDQGIVIRREKERDHTASRTIGSSRTQTMGWLLEVCNTREEPVTLTLCDQLPLSRRSDIAVTAEELSGGKLDPANGAVTWKLKLAPGEKRELHLRYKVKYPKDNRLTVE